MGRGLYYLEIHMLNSVQLWFYTTHYVDKITERVEPTYTNMKSCAGALVNGCNTLKIGAMLLNAIFSLRLTLLMPSVLASSRFSNCIICHESVSDGSCSCCCCGCCCCCCCCCCFCRCCEPTSCNVKVLDWSCSTQ